MRWKRDLRGLARRDFMVDSLRNATAYGVSPRLRCDVVLNNLVALGLDDRPRPAQERRDAVAAARPRPGHRQAFLATLDGAGRRRRRQGVQRRLDRWELPGPRPRAASSARSCPDSRSSSPPARRPDARNYRVNCDRVRGRGGFRPEWDVERGAAGADEAFALKGLTHDDVEGPRYQRIAQIRRLLGDGRLGRGPAAPASPAGERADGSSAGRAARRPVRHTAHGDIRVASSPAAPGGP